MLSPVTLAGLQMFSIITQVCLSYNVILNVWTVVAVSDLMGSASDKTEIIPRVQPLTPVAWAGSRILLIFMQNCLGWKMILSNIYCFNSRDAFLYDGIYFEVG